MVDLAEQAFSTNNFDLAVDIYERTIREKGPTSDLLLGLADSLVRVGAYAKAFVSYTNAYRYGKFTHEKLKHLVAEIIEAVVKQEAAHSPNHSQHRGKKTGMFTCGICWGLLDNPTTLPCGHTFCKNCAEKDESKTCEICSVVHYKLKAKNLLPNVVLVNLVDKWFPKESRAARLKRKGNELFSCEDFKKAVEMYNQAMEIVGQNHILLSNRSHAYASMDMFTEALQDAEQVVAMHPDWPKGYLRRGCALYGLGQYEDAVVSLLQCLTLDQRVAAAKEYLSKALHKILSALPPDDPKQQQHNASLLRQLVEDNFKQPVLVLNTLSDLAHDVRSVAQTPASSPVDHTPQVFQGSSEENPEPSHSKRQDESCNEKCCRYQACQDCDKRSDCPLLLLSSSPTTRKRLRHPSVTQGPVSPTHLSPQKVLKGTSPETSSVKIVKPDYSSLDLAEKGEVKPEQVGAEDLECGLCYRLFYEPVTTPCGHTFCRKCLDRCLDHTVSCPICKGNLREYLAERRQAVTDAIQQILETYFMEAYAERCRVNEEEMIELTRMGCGQQSDIPVFVCTLAFPTIPCPLHVFEPRYRLMIRQCMESGTRQFGMCVHTDIDSDEGFSNYGCMLEIRDVQYFPDGRSVVDTVGGLRFKVLSRGKRDGYNTAKVEFLADRPLDSHELPAINSLQAEIHAMVKNWLMRLPSANRVRIVQHFGDLPEVEASPFSSPNGPNWAWWAVAVLPMDPRVQMALLAMSSLKERLIALKKFLWPAASGGSSGDF